MDSVCVGIRSSLRTATIGFVLVVFAALSVLLPASADAEENPAALCGDDNIYVRITTWRGQTITRELPIATRGGCASSWATGEMSRAAVVGQCKRLEDGVFMHDGSFFQLTYPHTFYDLWQADNRADCVRILHGLATGELDADVLPFPF